jgi:para-nitrobenzyl esterase
MRATELQPMASGKTYAYYFRVESSIPMMKSGHAIELSSAFSHPEVT